MTRAIEGLLPSSGWRALTDGESRSLTAELRRELPPEHVLAGRDAAAIARRSDQDDVLFLVDGAELFVVHLTWRAETRAEWPLAQRLTSLDA